MPRKLRVKIQEYEKMSPQDRRSVVKPNVVAANPKKRHVSPIKPPPQGIGSGITGRPHIYDPISMPHTAKVLCAEYGFTSDQLAKVFGVAKVTVETWKAKFPEFKIAVREGMDSFDGIKVESTLLKLALGYEYDEQMMMKGQTIVTTKTAHPNVKALMFWLTNRQPDRWKNVTTVNAKVEGSVEHTDRSLKITADLSKMNTEQLKALRNMVAQQEGQASELNMIESPQIHIDKLLEHGRNISDAELI